MSTTREGCFSIVTVQNSIAKKVFKYTSGYALKTEVVNDGYEMVQGKSMESIICNEHAIHHFVSLQSKQTPFESLFPQYIEIPDHLKMHCLLMSAADQSLPEVIMTPRKLLSLATDVSRALAFLHSHAICHADIKPENVLWSRNGNRFQLADFGCANFNATQQQMYQDVINVIRLVLHSNKVNSMGFSEPQLITRIQNNYKDLLRQLSIKN